MIHNKQFSIFTLSFITAVLLTACSSQNTPQTQVALTIPVNTNGGIQWPTYNNRLDGQRFSPLEQINTTNASELGELCRIQIDGPTSFMAGLIVVDGIIYTNTGTKTVAIDATTCDPKWVHTYSPEDSVTAISNRGPAVLDGRVFRGTGDGRLIALDAKTGELLWKNIIANPSIAEFASAAPLAWQGVVYMGVAGSDLGIRGRIMAYDAATGKELWRFNTIPMGDEVGAETWEKLETAKTGGGGVWGAMSLDVMTNELFIPVGNPWPSLAPEWRPGNNLFTNSIVVLDASSGELKWWYQATPRDSHDLDLAAAPVLYRDSNIRDLVAFAGKDGHVISLDRETHEPIFRTAITRIENAEIPPSPEGTLVCPGFAGGVQWNGPTIDRVNNNLVTGVVDLCMTLVKGPVEYTPPNTSNGGTPVVVDDPVGAVVALNPGTGEIQWRYQAEKPVIAGVTPTAGGVTFTGDLAGNLLVLNSANGELLHKINTAGALAGGVVTYEINSTQYVAVASGNVSRNAFGVLGVPSVVIMALNPNTNTELLGLGIETSDNSLANGQTLYENICSTCHGAEGDMIADHPLSSLSDPQDQVAAMASTMASIKEPTLPMPKLFPTLLSEQDLEDVTLYVHRILSQPLWELEQ